MRGDAKAPIYRKQVVVLPGLCCCGECSVSSCLLHTPPLVLVLATMLLMSRDFHPNVDVHPDGQQGTKQDAIELPPNCCSPILLISINWNRRTGREDGEDDS